MQGVSLTGIERYNNFVVGIGTTENEPKFQYYLCTLFYDQPAADARKAISASRVISHLPWRALMSPNDILLRLVFL